MSLNQIKYLVTRNKLNEAIEKLHSFCTGPRANFREKIMQLEARWADFESSEIDGTKHHESINDIRRSIIILIQRLEKLLPQTANLSQTINSQLLLNDAFPFIDRKSFREKLESSLMNEKARIFLVEGESKSGMSYLEKLLKHLCENLDIYTLVSCEVPTVLAEPEVIKGERLIQFLSAKFDIEKAFDENDQFKFIQFINNLRKKIRKVESIPLFFLHDFHRIEDDNDNLLEFIYTLIDSLDSKFPKSVFIIAGLHYENLRHWHDELKYTTEIYKIEPVCKNDIVSCLKLIHDKYPAQINKAFQEKMSQQKYIDVMLEHLVQENQAFQIDMIGSNLRDHLFALKN